MRLLVTRPAPDGERTAQALRQRGHDVLTAPVLAFHPLDCEIADRPYAAVVMTSANAARALAGHPRCRALALLPSFTVGRHTAEAARAAGFREVHCADGDRNDLAGMLRSRLAGSEAPLLYLAGEDRAGDGELAPLAAAVVTAVVYRMVKAERFPPAVETALAQRRIDGVLHFSRRSCQAYLDCAARAGLIPEARAPLQFCLSRQVAEPLLAQELAAGIRIAPHPDEASLIALVDSC